MHLVQLLLPLNDKQGARLPPAPFRLTREELVARFGGITAYNRVPASGSWQQDGHGIVDDELIVYEVLCAEFDRPWWTDYRRLLEQRFDQEQLLARVQQVDLF